MEKYIYWIDLKEQFYVPAYDVHDLGSWPRLEHLKNMSERTLTPPMYVGNYAGKC